MSPASTRQFWETRATALALPFGPLAVSGAEEWSFDRTRLGIFLLPKRKRAAATAAS